MYTVVSRASNKPYAQPLDSDRVAVYVFHAAADALDLIDRIEQYGDWRIQKIDDLNMWLTRLYHGCVSDARELLSCGQWYENDINFWVTKLTYQP